MKPHFWLLVSLGFVALRAVLLAWVRAGMTEWGFVVQQRAENEFAELWICAALCGAVALWKTIRPWWRWQRRKKIVSQIGVALLAFAMMGVFMGVWDWMQWKLRPAVKADPYAKIAVEASR